MTFLVGRGGAAPKDDEKCESFCRLRRSDALVPYNEGASVRPLLPKGPALTLSSRLPLVAGPLVALALGAVACGSTPADDAPLGSDESAIIGGAADTSHEAVVAIISQQGNQAGACSGTIVKKQGRVAWVLTAAHCVDIPPTIVLMGPNYDAATAKRFEVLDYAAHPNYDGQTGNPADVAMVRILGANTGTPVIPITDAPDQLAVGTRLTSVGYGRTTPAGSAGGDNTIRKAITLSIAELSNTHVGYRYANGNICQGDSGGPAIRGTGTAERVVAVHSFVSGNCTQEAYSARLTLQSNYTFVQQQLAKAVPAESCDSCTKAESSGDNACALKQSECFSNRDCASLAECRNKCTDIVCTNACDARYPRGQAKFQAAANCTCGTTVCRSLCTAECKRVPTCGISATNDACGACTTASCCDPIAACAADTDCYICLKAGASADASCATNPLRKAVADCAATKCKADCVNDPIGEGGEAPPTTDGGAGGGGGGGGGTTTTTTTGCSVANGAGSGSGAAGGFGLALSTLAFVLVARRRQRRGA